MAWQAAQKHKVGLTWDDQQFCRCPDAITATTAPEAGNDRNFPVERTVQADWTSPVSSKLLLEASAVHKFDRWGANHLHIRDVIDPRMISVTEQGGAIPGLTYRAAAQFSDNFNRTDHWRFAASYITGSHAIKVGYNDANGINRSTAYVMQPVAYQFRDGIPNQITQRSLPHTQGVDVGPRPRPLRPGQVDHRPDDHQLRHPLRPLLQRLPGADAGADLLLADAQPGLRRARQPVVARRHAEDRLRLRRLGQRQDRA